jgi:hypothetical protein
MYFVWWLEYFFWCSSCYIQGVTPQNSIFGYCYFGNPDLHFVSIILMWMYLVFSCSVLHILLYQTAAFVFSEFGLVLHILVCWACCSKLVLRQTKQKHTTHLRKRWLFLIYSCISNLNNFKRPHRTFSDEKWFAKIYGIDTCRYLFY